MLSMDVLLFLGEAEMENVSCALCIKMKIDLPAVFLSFNSYSSGIHLQWLLFSVLTVCGIAPFMD